MTSSDPSASAKVATLADYVFLDQANAVRRS